MRGFCPDMKLSDARIRRAPQEQPADPMDHPDRHWLLHRLECSVGPWRPYLSGSAPGRAFSRPSKAFGAHSLAGTWPVSI